MNTPPPTSIEPTAPVTADELSTIAIAFVFPREHPAVRVLGLDSPVLLLTFALGLQWALRCEQLITDGIGSSGDLCDGVIQFQTMRLDEALKAVREWRDRNPGATFISSVGWFDQREQAWRVVARGALEIRFEDFLAPDRAQARTDIVGRMTQTLAELPKDFPWPLPQ